MELTFLGATHTVTGSKYYLETDHKKILIDCGLFQGLKELRLRNWNPLPLQAKEIDHVVLTHAHIDHSGYFPLLSKEGFDGKIWCTPGTKDLCSVLLPDSGYLQEEEAMFANKYGYSKHQPAKPLYTLNDAMQSLKQFEAHPFHEKIPVSPDTSVEFLHAGHIIGASMVCIHHRDQTLMFSGDLGRPHDSVMKAPEIPKKADVLVLEATYGNKTHPEAHPRIELANIINRTVERGGVVIIPAFAVGRAQALLYYLYELRKTGKIPTLPVYLDSPMAESATEIFRRYPHEHRLAEAEVKAMCQAVTYVKTSEESQALDTKKTPMIIISASGMVTGGRVLHHIKQFAPDAKNTILFSGYQAEGTRGQRILSGEKEIKMLGEVVPINAEVAALDNLSAHSDANETIAWLKQFQHRPKHIFLTHAETDSALVLKARIEKELQIKCTIPQYGQRMRVFGHD